jgi:hypothetical protein
MAEPNQNQIESGTALLYARVAGFLYLVIIVLGLLGEAGVRNSLIVSGDASATAQRILESEFLWRLHIAGQYVLLVSAIAMTLIWYVLLRPVNHKLTLLAVFFALVSLAVEAVGDLHLQDVLIPLSGAGYLKTVDPQQLHALAYMSVVAHAHAFGVALIFFGIECLIVGYLVRKSGYFPKAIGAMMQIAGACYLVNSFSMILSPPLQGILFPTILLPSFVGESAFCLWLLVKGLDVSAWERQSGGPRVQLENTVLLMPQSNNL